MDPLRHTLEFLLFCALLVDALDLVHLLLKETSNARRATQTAIAHEPISLRHLLLQKV